MRTLVLIARRGTRPDRRAPPGGRPFVYTPLCGSVLSLPASASPRRGSTFRRTGTMAANHHHRQRQRSRGLDLGPRPIEPRRVLAPTTGAEIVIRRGPAARSNGRAAPQSTRLRQRQRARGERPADQIRRACEYARIFEMPRPMPKTLPCAAPRRALRPQPESSPSITMRRRALPGGRSSASSGTAHGAGGYRVALICAAKGWVASTTRAIVPARNSLRGQSMPPKPPNPSGNRRLRRVFGAACIRRHRVDAARLSPPLSASPLASPVAAPMIRTRNGRAGESP